MLVETSRLQFTKEEREIRLEKPIRKVDRAADQADEKVVPTAEGQQRTVDPETGAVTVRCSLRFEAALQAQHALLGCDSGRYGAGRGASGGPAE